MKYFLDDTRTPDMIYTNSTWVLLQSPTELVFLFKQHYDQITHISFDHDLNWYEEGEEITGYHTLQMICEVIMDLKLDPNQYTMLFHSANPVGRENMVRYWENFRRYHVTAYS